MIYPTRSVDPGTSRHYQMLLDSGNVTRVYLEEWAQPRRTVMQQVMGVLLVEPPQAIAEGEQEGQQKGQQEGEQEGRQKEGAALLLRLLRCRCGEVAPAMREHVTRLPLPQLEALGEALLDFHSVADLEQWLVTQEARSEEQIEKRTQEGVTSYR